MAIGWVVVAQDGSTPPDDEVSAFVYPESVDTLRFDHSKHADVPCVDCHGAARTSRRATDSLVPPMKACAGCHSSEAKPALADCAGCHVGHEVRADGPVESREDWEAVRPAPMIPPRESANLRFDHAAHAATACTTCHSTASGTPSMPTMASCVDCHQSSPGAPDDCTTCHPTDPGTGRIATTDQRAATSLKPDDHTVDFLRRHGTVMRGDPEDCMSCHTEEDCASCHTESMATKPFSVHPPNFMTIHAVDARSGSGECTDCHTVQTFCTTCHVRANVTTRPGHRPPPRRRYHPPGWLDSTAANNHGVMSRRDITECASCHSESDCISCHAGVDPHPPEFRLSCGRLLAANPTPCARCHDDPGALRLMCQ
jgi:hypothetical protein